MLSDEEKKAIEELKKVRWNSLAVVVKNEDGKMDISYFTEKHKKTLLNLIEKQSKEIEELKDESKEYQIGFAQGCYEKDLDWKDKIKAKIEEYDDKGMTVNLANRSAGKTFQQAVHYEVKKALQSLLEKE